MPETTPNPQGPRFPERAAVMLTDEEKADLKLVRQTDGKTESELLRGFTISEILARAAEIKAAHHRGERHADVSEVGHGGPRGPEGSEVVMSSAYDANQPGA